MQDKNKPQLVSFPAATDISRNLWADMMQNTSNDLLNRMGLVVLDMEMLQSTYDALYSHAQDAEGKEKAALENLLRRFQYEYDRSIINEVAEKTGADPAQLANKDARTPEQEQEIISAYSRRELARRDAFERSNYMQAFRALDEYESVFDHDKPREASENFDIFSIKEAFLVYYFTTRPDIRPSATGNFTETDKEELMALYGRFEKFFTEYLQDTVSTQEIIDLDFIHVLQAFIAKENPVNADEIIEHLSSVLPAKYVIPNNKLANTLTKGIIDIGRIILEESRRGAKKLVETTCILTYEGDNVHLSGRQPFTEYDRNVYNAVSSLYVYGDQSHVVTPAMVYRAMTGLTDSEKPTAGQLAAVTRSLDKMRFIRARIDCTEELKARRITLNSKQINGGEIDTYLLTADAIKVQAGGQTVRAYRIIKAPVLYEYSAAVKQVLTLPASVLDVKELNPDGSIGARLPNTESRIKLKGYMIRRIEGMKGKNGLNNPVIALYDYQRDGETHQGLYSIAGKPDADRKEMQRIREDAEKMLAYWAATGYIKAFEAQTERKKITGYKITV